MGAKFFLDSCAGCYSTEIFLKDRLHFATLGLFTRNKSKQSRSSAMRGIRKMRLSRKLIRDFEYSAFSFFNVTINMFFMDKQVEI